MKESFVFYASFLEAIEELDDDTQLKIFKAISNFALKNEEPQNITGVAKAIFALIKPQIIANNKRYEDGKKGGRPKKENIKTSGFENKKPVVLKNEENKKPNVNANVNENVNENVNVNVNVNENENFSFLEKKQPEKKTEKKSDPFIDNPIVEKFKSEHERIIGTKLYLSAQQRMKIMELNSDIPEFMDTITKAFTKIKNIDFDLPNFTANGCWLLKENNYTNVLNGMYDRNETKEESKDWRENPPDWYKKAMERKRAEGCIYD